MDSTATSTPLLARAYPSHTTFEIRDVKESLRFYTDVLGLATMQHIERGGLWRATNNHITACVQVPNLSPQPYWNYHARPVPAERVDELYGAIRSVADTYEIRDLRAPEREHRFGITTYGFAFTDRDGNWWRIEENAGPFGPCDLSDEPHHSIVPPGPISYCTLEVVDLDATLAFYREVLGFRAVVRDGAIHVDGGTGVHVVAVPAADVLPQPVLNHHGVTLPAGSNADVEAVHAFLKSPAAEPYGIKRVMNITRQHGSYSFYFQDRDTNWWEIETLEGGLDPWQRASLPDGDARKLAPNLGISTLRDP